MVENENVYKEYFVLQFLNVLFNGAVNFYAYISSVMREWMGVEHW
jgi:hypothetical protein